MATTSSLRCQFNGQCANYSGCLIFFKPVGLIKFGPFIFTLDLNAEKANKKWDLGLVAKGAHQLNGPDRNNARN